MPCKNISIPYGYTQQTCICSALLGMHYAQHTLLIFDWLTPSDTPPNSNQSHCEKAAIEGKNRPFTPFSVLFSGLLRRFRKLGAKSVTTNHAYYQQNVFREPWRISVAKFYEIFNTFEMTMFYRKSAYKYL